VANLTPESWCERVEYSLTCLSFASFNAPYNPVRLMVRKMRYYVVSTQQSQRLQTRLRLRDKNAMVTSSGRALMILIVSRLQAGVNGRDLRAESCRLITMQTVTPVYPKCAIAQTMKSQGRSMLQYNAKQDLIPILKKNMLIFLMI